eukprot:Tbor_TRINITY_DN5853_c1_g3::TRINITY_DN5853_c1_g3_i1::g.7033::m.7033/K00088/IMPDH, guaB; IMP dehydrogenase
MSTRKVMEVADKPIPLGLTYDDVLLVPKRSTVRSRKEVSTTTRLSKNIVLKVPIVSSNMDTVTESTTAVQVAREGGIGILHRFCTEKEQCDMVRRVKRAQSLIIEEPVSVTPDTSLCAAYEALNWPGRRGGVKSLIVVNNLEEKIFMGVITEKDLRFAPESTIVKNIMTPAKNCVTIDNPNISLDEARKLFQLHRTSNIPVLDKAGCLIGLITAHDCVKLTKNTIASLDHKSRLLVGAAIGVKSTDMDRAISLVKAGVDVLVVDIAHGHSGFCLDMIERLKKNEITSTVDIIAGNIATGEAAEALIKAGADALKVGVGPGSICITRLVAGSGVPQLTAIMEVYKVARRYNIPVIADGGIKSAGDISKAIAAGASTVMLGNILAGTDEAPGRVLVKEGRKVKIIRGMAGYGANISKAEREQRIDDDVFLDIVPEGVEGIIPYKGPLGPIVKQLVGGLRSGISYCGATNLQEMREYGSLVRMTGAGLRESGSHDISKL